jgi:allantoinase
MEPQRYGPFQYVPINRRPTLTWPHGARVALWVIPNLETFPLHEPVPGGTGKAPDIINWAPRDYGNRVSVFRLMEVMARHGVRGTAALNSEVCDDYPQVIEDALQLGWEFMGHNQSNARHLHLMSPEAHSTGLCGKRYHRAAKASRREDLQVEHPVLCR